MNSIVKKSFLMAGAACLGAGLTFSATAAVLVDYPVVIQAESATEAFGCSIQSWGVSNFDAGDYIKFDDVDISDFKEFTATAVSGDGYKSNLEVRIDSPDGPLIAVAPVATSTNWWPPMDRLGTAFADQATGIHDLYVTCSGDALGNLDSLKFQVKREAQMTVSSVVGMDTNWVLPDIYFQANGVWETTTRTIPYVQDFEVTTAPFNYTYNTPNKVDVSEKFWCWVGEGPVFIVHPESLTTVVSHVGSGSVSAVYAGDNQWAKVTPVETIGGKIVQDKRFAFKNGYFPIRAEAYNGYAFSHWEVTVGQSEYADLEVLDEFSANTALRFTCNYWSCQVDDAELRAHFIQQ